MADQAARDTFLLKFLSPETGCSAHEVRFTAPADQVAEILDSDSNQLENHTFFVGEEALGALSALIGPLPRPDGDVTLCRPRSIDGTPYLVHTSFELPLMLDGRKPLSVFLDAANSYVLATTRSYFDRHIQAGLVLERLASLRIGDVECTSILYCLPGEEWRFEAYTELMARPRPWTDGMERELGYLLGYTEAECDWWMTERKRLGSLI